MLNSVFLWCEESCGSRRMLYENDNSLRDNSSHNKKAEINNRLKFVVSKQNSLNSLNSLMLHDREILFNDKYWILMISRVLTRLRLWWRVAFDSLRMQLFWRKVVGKSANGNPERYCGWFWIHCSSKKFERITREATDVCLRVQKKATKVASSTATVSGTVYWSYSILPFGIVACTFSSTTFSKYL